MKVERIACLLLFGISTLSEAFVQPSNGQGSNRLDQNRELVGGSRSMLFSSSSSDTEATVTMMAAADGSDDAIFQEQGKFKILTCMSTSCCQKRKVLGLDSLSTFGAMYSRATGTRVEVEEAPCLGSCKNAPCIGVEHEDFFGCVALEGMTSDEFGAKAFHNIVTEEDADRVWSCVENAVQMMIEADDEDDDDE